MAQKGAPPVLGIDLGTTKSLACVYQDGKPQPIITDAKMGTSVLPSIVCIGETENYVGRKAVEKTSDLNLRDSVISHPKRQMGEANFTYAIGDQKYSPTEISAVILRKIRESAEAQLGCEISEAVVTVPANFGDMERSNTRQAAYLADFSKVHLLDEPIAAALGLSLQDAEEERLAMVLDLGGGTLDVTLILAGQENGIVELGRTGHQKLGGVEWDIELAKMAVFQGDALRGERIARPREFFFRDKNYGLYSNIEQMKHDFCETDSKNTLQLRYKDEHADGKTIVTPVSKGDFIKNTAFLSEACGLVCDELLNDVSDMLMKRVAPRDLRMLRRKRKNLFDFSSRKIEQLRWEHIDEVHMVGGGSNVPAVLDVIRQRLRREPTIKPRPQFRIAYGAAVYADNLQRGQPIKVRMRCPHTTGYYQPIKGGEDKFHALILRNSPIPQTVEWSAPLGGNGETFRITLGQERREIKLRKGKIHSDYKVVADLNLDDLPPPENGELDNLYFRVDYSESEPLKVTIRVRGKELVWGAAQ